MGVWVADVIGIGTHATEASNNVSAANIPVTLKVTAISILGTFGDSQRVHNRQMPLYPQRDFMQPERLAKAPAICYNSHRHRGSHMALLYLIRHARAQMLGDAAERWPLSEQGRREAGILARQNFWREVELLFSSPEPKALQTAGPVARRWGIPLVAVDCLHEVHRPQLIPDYEIVIARLFAQPETSIAGVEPAAQAAERITDCIKGLVAAHPGQTLAVVSHGLILTLFLARLEDRWPTVAEWHAVPFTGLAVVDTTTWHLVKGWSSISEAS